MTAATAAVDPAAPQSSALSRDGLVGVSEAARRLGINKSTVSRQVAKGIIPNHGTPAQPLVDVAEALHARRTNLDLSKQRGQHSALGVGEGEAGPAEGAGADDDPSAQHLDARADQRAPEDGDEPSSVAHPAAAAPRSDGARLKFNQAATADKALQAKIRALDFAERTDRLVGKVGVDKATADVFRNLRDRILAVPQQAAGQLATMTDERLIRQTLRAALSAALTGIAGETDDAAPDPLEDDPEIRAATGA